MRLTRAALVVLALQLAGCAGGTTATTAAPPTSTSPPSSTTTTAPPTSTVTSQPPAPTDVAVCVAGDVAFDADGLIATLGQPAGDAATVGGVRWIDHGPCERLVVDLLTADGAPAVVLGETSVSFAAGLGVVRIELPAQFTAVTTSIIEGPLVDRVYVVRLENGRLAVDIHLGDDPVAVRSFDVGEPARVVVDIVPWEDGLRRQARPIVGEGVVVLAPVPGAVAYPLTVTGYARTFEATVVATLAQGNEEVAREFTTATDWIDSWGEFSITFTDGPDGEAMLFVGEFDARDGSPMGVEIPLDLS